MDGCNCFSLKVSATGRQNKHIHKNWLRVNIFKVNKPNNYEHNTIEHKPSTIIMIKRILRS